LALVLALGSLGIGFAHWSDSLWVEGTVETGEVLVGFTRCCTDDDVDMGTDYYDDCWDDGSDPLAVGECPEVCTNCPNIGKDVATTTCQLLNQKTDCEGEPAEHNGMAQYGTLEITMDNVYPQYNPSVYFEISNCGSIPVNIVGAWIISGPPGVDPNDPTTWIYLPKCEMVQVDLGGTTTADDIGIGFSGPAEPQQIDPCNAERFDLHFCVKQDYPECTTLDFEIKIHAVQWNYEWAFPDGLP
jgi:predicted ribosomally synthesized peptide with SipW-like signal peptide